MKKNKMLAVLLSMTIGVCGITACNNDDNKEEKDKVTVMFEIDEGLGGYEFVAGCKTTTGAIDYQKIDVVLNNVYSGIKGLQQKYDVALHIYPDWYYKASGWNTNYTDGLQKWSDDFIYVMEFCKKNNLGVYLEYLSSTIYVSQNGEEGLLPIVDLYDGLQGSKEVWGVSCDFQSMEALKTHYGDVFKGIRFHELIGTDSLALNGDKHACRIYEEDIFAIADEVKKLDIELVWSDQFWSNAFKNSQYWFTRVDTVKEKIGDNLTIMVANNTSDVVSTANFTIYDQLVNKYSDVKMGYSNQAWFVDAYCVTGSNYQAEGQTYIPVEIVAGFAQKAIKRGAKIIQIEPYFHLFNYTRQSINGGKDYSAGGKAMNSVTPRYEEIQNDQLDYSPKTSLYQLVDYLNDDNFKFSNVENFFDESSTKVVQNSSTSIAKNYQQTTLHISGDSDIYLDSYNNNIGTWYEQNANRYTSRVINSNNIYEGAISYTYGAYDDIFTVVKEGGKNVGYLYNSIGGKVLVDKTTFVDNNDGEFVGFVAANLIQTKSYRKKDSDEIIVFRKKGNVINLSLYAPNSSSDGYSLVTGVSSSILLDFFGSTSINSENFVNIVRITNSRSIGKTSSIRPIDGLLAIYKTDKGMKIIGKRKPNSVDISTTIDLSGDLLCCTAADVNLDINSNDELVVVVRENSLTNVKYLTFMDNRSFNSPVTIQSINNNPSRITAIEKYYYVNDATI